MTTLSARERLRRLSGRRFESIDLPGLEGLRVQSLNEGERAIVEEFATGDRRRMKRAIVALSLVDSAGARVYPFDLNDAVALQAILNDTAELDGAIVDAIVASSMKLNKISEADIKSLLGEPAAS